MLLKMDFETTNESVSWSCLDTMMNFMNFGYKWCAWIRACLISTKSSILVNRIPTDEFRLYRGL